MTLGGGSQRRRSAITAALATPGLPVCAGSDHLGRGGFGAAAEAARWLRAMTKSAGTIVARNVRSTRRVQAHPVALDKPNPTRAGYARGHWGIEAWHHLCDTAHAEDALKGPHRHRPRAMASLRNPWPARFCAATALATSPQRCAVPPAVPPDRWPCSAAHGRETRHPAVRRTPGRSTAPAAPTYPWPDGVTTGPESARRLRTVRASSVPLTTVTTSPPPTENTPIRRL